MNFNDAPLEGNQKFEHMYKNLFLKLFLLFDYVLILDEPFKVFVVELLFYYYLNSF